MHHLCNHNLAFANTASHKIALTHENDTLRKKIPQKHALSNLRFDLKTSVFLSRFGCQNDTLKFCNDTLNSQGQDMVLPCIEVKIFEESIFSCTWPLQQTAGML